MKSKFKLLALILALSLLIVAWGPKNINTTAGEIETPEVETGNKGSKETETSNEETETEKESTKEETTVETTGNTNNNTPSEAGKLDVNKLIDTLNGLNGTPKPFSVKVTGKQKVVENGTPHEFNAESSVVFDGKTKMTKSLAGKTYTIAYYTLDGNKVNVLTGMGTD